VTIVACFFKDFLLSDLTGRTRFNRLFAIGVSSTQIYLEALKAAIVEAKQGKDVQRYEEALSVLQEVAPQDPDASPDHLWMDKTKKQVKSETDRMELELKGYKNNLIKESIRVGYGPRSVRIKTLIGFGTDGL